VKNYEAIKAKGVDIVAVVAANDPFVMSGWARVEGLKDKVKCSIDSWQFRY
jgi:alkyl hydroperoxide reductase 1